MEVDNVEILPNDALEAVKAERADKLAKFEVKRVARSLLVPTDDGEVRQNLRMRRLPVCFFGEDAHDRRERLRAIMAQEAMKGTPHPKREEEIRHQSLREEKSKEVVTEKREEYYTEGSQDLKRLRLALAGPSLRRATYRLRAEKRLAGISDKAHPDRQRIRDEERKLVDVVRGSHMVSSQIGDQRPLSAISYGVLRGGKGAVVVTGSWNGNVKVWECENTCANLQTLTTHSARISNVSIPRETGDILLTSSADCTAGLHRITETGGSLFELQHLLRGHSARVTDAKLHPFRSSLIATCSFDGSFILHDDAKILLKQESGHERVYRLNFHIDGSLLGTCGLDGGIRIWDMRSGRAMMTMEKAHVDDVLGLEFSGDGRVVASCGKDNLVKIWDLRTRKCAKTIAAHRSLISGIRFGGGVNNSDVLFTCSFDRTIKCWSGRRNWGLLAAYTSHDDKVTAIDCSADGYRVVSACYDKTWKLWGNMV